MKAKKVYENIDFERGKDPKTAMGLGLDHSIYNKWEEALNDPKIGSIGLDESLNRKWHLTIYPQNLNVHPDTISKAVRKYFGDYLARGYNVKANEIHIHILPEFERNFIKAFNMRYGNWPIEEAVSFEKGKDPKDSMNIGVKQKILQDMLALNNVPGVLGMQYRKSSYGYPILFVKYTGSRYDNEGQTWEAIVNEHMGEYVDFDLGNPDDDYFSFQIQPEYAKFIREILKEDEG